MSTIKYFDEITPRVDLPAIEEELISYWKKNRIFEKSINSRPKNKRWTFLDGPPFITGLPHYGSLLSSIPKDIFPRFWTMKGYRVRRVWGWDCHGLPAEHKVEKKLGINKKRDIEEKIGIKRFIDECKHYVTEVSSEWEWYVDHVARWVDFKNSYKTMDKDYMESVMWVFKSIYDKGYIYKGLRISLYCPRCSTPISNFEVAMDAENHKTVTEPANIYKYQLEKEKNTFLLAWSTTPWTKIVTPALAINPKLTYVKVKQGDEYYVLAKSTLAILNRNKKYKIVDSFKGSKLVGAKFVPHYNFYEIEKGKNSFIVIGGDFVTADEGTGIVTLAVYGEEDLVVMNKHNIQLVMHIDDEGNLTKDVPKWGGIYYLDVNPLVNKDLKDRGLMYKEENHTHTIPHCWRCGTRLFYNPQNAWYIDIQKLKKKLLATNKKVNWHPKHFKFGRFQKSIEAAPDWCISRSRYWGSPVPVWECKKCKDKFVPGSIKEIENESGQKVKELHRPEIDEISIKCKKCGGVSKRVPEVLDSWVEAGSASFAERHYPFSKVMLEDFFPPDFIVEYTGQIRAWFYVLHVISNAIFDSIAFKNVLVTGVILGTDGRKMSKNFGNYPDPKMMLQKYGGDALRLYLMKNPVMRGEDMRISEDDYAVEVKNFILILWNIYNFFVMNANLDYWKPEIKQTKSENILDIWLIERLKEVTLKVTDSLENYDTVTSTNSLQSFVDDFSRWYVRRSRDRIGINSLGSETDKISCYQTYYSVLEKFIRLSAPFIPFITEKIYGNLTKNPSVHLQDWPETNGVIDYGLIEEMKSIRQIVEKIHAERKKLGITLKQPLKKATIYGNYKKFNEDLIELIKDEVNVKSIEFKKGKDKIVLDTKLTSELVEELKTRELIRKIQDIRKTKNMNLDQKISVVSNWLPESKELKKLISRKTLSTKLTKGKLLSVNSA